MKGVKRSILLVSLLSLAACSTNNVMYERAQVDHEYMKQVEAASRKANQSPRIYWINPPMKKTPTADPSDN